MGAAFQVIESRCMQERGMNVNVSRLTCATSDRTPHEGFCRQNPYRVCCARGYWIDGRNTMYMYVMTSKEGIRKRIQVFGIYKQRPDPCTNRSLGQCPGHWILGSKRG